MLAVGTVRSCVANTTWALSTRVRPAHGRALVPRRALAPCRGRRAFGYLDPARVVDTMMRGEAVTTAAEKDDDFDHDEEISDSRNSSMEEVGDDESGHGYYGPGSSPWPYMSTLDEALGGTAAGGLWPFQTNLGDGALASHLASGSSHLSLSDITLLARTLERLPDDSPERLLVLERINDPAAEALVSGCSTGVLAALVRALTSIPRGELSGALFRKASGELLQRTPLLPRHAVQLLGALGVDGNDGGPVVGTAPVLRVAAESFQQTGLVELSSGDLIVALEGLARTRAGPRDAVTDGLLLVVAESLSPWFRGGGALGSFVVGAGKSDARRALVLRLLAALWVLPELAGHRNSGIVAWLTSAKGIRWPSTLPPTITEEQVAAAACFMARCGAWTTSRSGYLLAQALRRDMLALKGAQGRPVLTPQASALWLCAIAQAGVPLEAATDKPEESFAEHAEDALLGGVETLVGNAANATVDATDMARALWALCALGKTDARDGLGAALLECLSKLDPSSLSSEARTLLVEARAALGSDSNEGGDDDTVESPFAAEDWQSAFSDISGAEKLRLEQSGRIEELREVLSIGEMVGETEVADVSEHVMAGQYCATAMVGSHTVLLDLDALQTPTNRALRRKQWAALLPDTRVAEISLADWDRNGGIDRRGLVRRRLLGVEDDNDDASDED